MGKLVSISDAAKSLGVTRQTIQNWVRYGVLNILEIKNKSQYVDSDVIEQIRPSMSSVLAAEEFFEQKKRDYEDAAKELDTTIKEIEEEVLFRKRTAHFTSARSFYESIPTMLYQIGVLKEREAEVVLSLMRGDTFEDISNDMCITRERVRQVYEKAVRKSRHLSHLKETIEERDALKLKCARLEHAVETMASEMRVRQRPLTEQEELLTTIHNKSVTDFHLSVRCVNCLRAADINTIGELVGKQKNDLLKLRNFGRKSMSEIDDLFAKYGLEWGMDIDDILLRQDCKQAQ